MSKYKPLNEPITRREACLILDRKRLDAAVRSQTLIPLGKVSGGTIVPADLGPATSPLVFAQHEVRELSANAATSLKEEARERRAQAKEFKAMKPPLTRRQIATILGPKLTGVLIRSGRLRPYGSLDDTQTSAHTYEPQDISTLLLAIAEEADAESKLLNQAAKTRIPA